MAPKSKTYVRPTWICEPEDESCVAAPPSTFLPGISVKHSPSCTGNICGLFACDGGNWRVTSQGTLDRSEWIKGWAMTQLFTRGFVECAEHPLGKRDGGWWADAFRNQSGYAQFRSGSKLWALQWVHGGATNDLLWKAKDYAAQALDPLLQWGIVTRLTVDALYLQKYATQAFIHLIVAFAGPGVASEFTLEGSQQPSSDWLWQEYKPPSRTIGRSVTKFAG